MSRTLPIVTLSEAGVNVIVCTCENNDIMLHRVTSYK